MKTLIKVGEFAWLDPSAIDALIDTVNGVIAVLTSGESVTLHGLTADDVINTFEEALTDE